jgi:hypothetical protein
MYTLRRISGQGAEMNLSLGSTYTVIHRDTAYDLFRSDFERFFGKPYVSDIDHDDDIMRVYAFVASDGGKEIYPLYTGQQAYVMTESGATISNLTMK